MVLSEIAKLFSGPLAIRSESLQAFVNASRVWDESKAPKAQESDPTVVGGTAIVRLCGVIVPEANPFMEMFGYCGLNNVRAQIDAAIGDQRVQSILLYIDSPGGVVYGVPEFAEYLRKAGKKKNIYGFVGAECFSAGYWIGSAVKELSITPSGAAGSIGVWTGHMDISGALEKEGVKVTLVKAGEYKIEENMYEPLTEEARDNMQERVDEIYSNFVNSVAKNRGVSAKTVLSDFGQGRTMSAKKALDAGLVDSVLTLETLMSRLPDGRNGASKRRVSALEEQVIEVI